MQVLGAGLTFVGVVVKFYTELVNGYLTPMIKLLSAGGGTGADVWTLYNMTATSLIAFGVAVVLSGTSYRTQTIQTKYITTNEF